MYYQRIMDYNRVDRMRIKEIIKVFAQQNSVVGFSLQLGYDGNLANGLMI